MTKGVSVQSPPSVLVAAGSSVNVLLSTGVGTRVELSGVDVDVDVDVDVELLW